MESLNEKELLLVRGCLRLKRMYKGMKHAPHGVVVWEDDWMQDSLDRCQAELDKRFPNAPKWKT